MKNSIFQRLRSVFAKNPEPDSQQAEPNTPTQSAASDDVSIEDLPMTMIRMSGARAGEVFVMSSKLMDARLATVQALMELSQGRPNEARSQFQRAAELVRPYRGPIDQETLDLIAKIAEWSAKFEDLENSNDFFQRAVDAALADANLGCEALSDALLKVGVLLPTHGFEEAQALLSRAAELHQLRFGQQHARTGAIMHCLAGAFEAGGDATSSAQYYELAASVRRTALGEEHADTAGSYDAVARALLALEDLEKALEWAERGCAIRERLLGPTTAPVANSLETIGLILKRQGDLKSAEVLFRRAVRIFEDSGSEEDGASAILLGNLASILMMTGRLAEAMAILNRVLTIKEQIFGPVHPSTAHTLFQLANLYASQGDFPSAHPLARRACAINNAFVGSSHPDAQRTRQLLAQIEKDMSRIGQV